MKIRLQNKSNNIETVTLEPPITVRDHGHFSILQDAHGNEYFFSADGFYDGWNVTIKVSSRAATPK
jgi:hypothetical protein